ncbi:MAG: hypothetical protein RL457_1127, partial [Pseudomonadota bacterium]
PFFTKEQSKSLEVVQLARYMGLTTLSECLKWFFL